MEPKQRYKRWPFARGGGSTIALASAVTGALITYSVKRPSRFSRLLAAAGVLLWLLILYFFRDPERSPEQAPGVVLSAADGEVVEIEVEREETYLQCEATRISVFLSIFDVHVQRAPISGRVRSVQHRSGKFLQAFRPEASTENEHIAMLIDTDYGPVLVKQIAGILARRCVNDTRPGDMVYSGQRFGMIKFGSRVDLFLPANAQVFVAVGDKVAGGLSPVARLAEHE